MSKSKVNFDKDPNILREYHKYQRNVQGVLESTVYQRLLFVRPFVRHFGDSRAKIREIRAGEVHQYVMKAVPKLSRKYCKEFLCALRSFFKFILFKGYTNARLSDALPKLPNWRLSDIPRGIEWESVQKLLAAPNRSRPNGKRNYAFLLLLASYGVRRHQATHLKLRDIRWREGLINFSVCKGGRPLCFPLYENVAEALLDYIQNARGRHDFEEVFLQKRTSIKPIGLGSLDSTLKIYYQKAGINSRSKGFHAIRHAFATKLMTEQTPIKNISDLLGHRSIKSTYIYTKVDLPQLRTLCRDWPQVAL
jgi:site-specific recombinase XerD